MPTANPPRSRLRRRSRSRSRTGQSWFCTILKALDNKNRKGVQGQEKKGALQPYYRVGKLIPHTIDPWMNIEQIFMTALAQEGLLKVDDDTESLTEEDASEQDRFKERQVDAYRKILALVPNMHDLVKRLCDTMQDNDEDLNQSHLFKFIEVLHESATQAQIADSLKVNNAICELMVKDTGDHITPPVPNEKCMRGWEHIDTGRLLCPVRELRRGGYNTDKLAKLKADEVHVTAYDYPLFLYDEDMMQAGDIMAGLCRGFLLLRVVEEMLFGSGKPRVTKHATKDSIAVKYGITQITPSIIAYGATQARFALSSIREWPMQDMLFELDEFYYNVLEI
ncbi:hypothetical protein AGABI2DRAFT_181181, partial [Agaricus bisporus var. bisporus H97]|uniref:hypothetical protein n=1 Tax=Agaricus bisporus var. bisporus (strain H97 / ATCC MYA-4626 / FGSC 10389) TaxID=936046 RepID=UPI00029F5E1E